MYKAVVALSRWAIAATELLTEQKSKVWPATSQKRRQLMSSTRVRGDLDEPILAKANSWMA